LIKQLLENADALPPEEREKLLKELVSNIANLDQ
jgi:hypothetical protein